MGKAAITATAAVLIVWIVSFTVIEAVKIKTPDHSLVLANAEHIKELAGHVRDLAVIVRDLDSKVRQ